MGLFSKRNGADTRSAEGWQTDPQEALRVARTAIAAGGTHVDQNGNRRRLTLEMREHMVRSLDSAARAHDARSSAPSSSPAIATSVTGLPIWPSGIARFADGILEVTTGEGFRVAAGDILEIAMKASRAGRLSLTVSYRAGLDQQKRGYWVEPDHEAALRELVYRVNVGRGEA